MLAVEHPERMRIEVKKKKNWARARSIEQTKPAWGASSWTRWWEASSLTIPASSSNYIIIIFCRFATKNMHLKNLLFLWEQNE